MIRLYFWLLSLSLVGCGSPDFEQMAKNRMELARQKTGDIQIAVFNETQTKSYLNGVMLAVEEINLRPNKLVGRTLKVEVEQDGESFESTKSSIRRTADNPEISAVLGHANSRIAIPASVIYERSQLVFLPSFSIQQGLTSHNFQYVFRMMPNAKILAEQLASVAKILGYRKVVILFSRDDINRELAFLFEDAALQQGIELSQNSSFFTKETNFRPLISQFSNKEFDAVFIAAAATPTAEMVKQLREMGINKPILGSDTLNQGSYLETAGEAAQNTIAPSVFRPNRGNQRSVDFIKHYLEKYSLAPDASAAQGYDSVMLLAAAIEKAGSTIPALLSSTLHYMPPWIGVTGLHAFSQVGDVLGKKYVFNVWQRGQWRPMPAIHVPYLLKRYERKLPLQNQASGKEQPFTEVFAKRLSNNEEKMHLLALAQTILKFNRIAVIHEDSENGRRVSDFNLIKQVGDRRGFEVSDCLIPFADLSRSQIERQLVTCYGKLALITDTQYISPFGSLNQALVNKLNRILPLFKSSSLSLDSRQANINPSLLLDKRSDVDPLGLGDMQVYRSLLNGKKVQELAESLFEMPEIAINLNELLKLEVSNEALLDLSPDAFLGLGGIAEVVNQEAMP